MKQTLPFSFPVVIETADYRVVEIGNGLHVISKIDGTSFQLGKGSEAIYAKRSNKSEKPIPVETSGAIYVSPVEVTGD